MPGITNDISSIHLLTLSYADLGEMSVARFEAFAPMLYSYDSPVAAMPTDAPDCSGEDCFDGSAYAAGNVYTIVMSFYSKDWMLAKAVTA